MERKAKGVGRETTPTFTYEENCHLIELIRAIYIERRQPTVNLVKVDWPIIKEKFDPKSTCVRSLKNIQLRWKTMKREFYLLKELRSLSGWEWDDEKHMVVAPSKEDEGFNPDVPPPHTVQQPVDAEPSTYSDSIGPSRESVSSVLESVLLMQDRYIRLPDANSPIHHSVRESPFKGALGAIDGTHVPAHVHKKYYLGRDGTGSLDRFRNRKGDITQNVLAAVDFDMKFVHVHAGFEGSAHDSKVLGKAIDTGFTVPSGRYYLADGGYSNTPSFISPYRSYPYHLAQFRERTGRQMYRCPEDKFNHRHTLLRNIVERAFGVLKGRFKILQFKRPYIYPRQVDIVIACCVIHNFLKCQNGIYNNIDERFEREGTALNEDGSVDGSNLDVLAGLGH